MIADDGYLKLIDYGFAKVVKKRTYTICGTPEYIAPEILAANPAGLSRTPRLSAMVGSAAAAAHNAPRAVTYDARYVDAWSLGVLMFELICNTTPFGLGGNPPQPEGGRDGANLCRRPAVRRRRFGIAVRRPGRPSRVEAFWQTRSRPP